MSEYHQNSKARVRRARPNTGRFPVSDCQRRPKPARYDHDEAVQVKEAALMRLTLFENQPFIACSGLFCCKTASQVVQQTPMVVVLAAATRTATATIGFVPVTPAWQLYNRAARIFSSHVKKLNYMKKWNKMGPEPVMQLLCAALAPEVGVGGGNLLQTL